MANFVDEHFELVFPLQLHLCLHGYPQFSQNELVLVSLVPCHSLNQGCKRFLKHFHASCQQSKTLFDTVRLHWFRRLYTLIIHQKVAHAFSVLTASKPMKLNLMLQTWKLLVYVVSFSKEKYYRKGNFGEN